MKKILIYLILMLTLIGLVSANEVTLTTNSPVNAGEQLKLTFTLNSQTGVNLWKIKNIVVPASWSYVDKSTTGTSGTTNTLCGTQDDGKFACSMFADTGATVAKTLTLTYTTTNSLSSVDLVGNWETYTPVGVQNSGNFGVCAPSCTGKVCGDNGCGGSCGACDAGKTCSSGQCIDSQSTSSDKSWLPWVIGGGIVILFMVMMKKR